MPDTPEKAAPAHTCRLCGGHLVQSVNTYVHADTLDEDCPSQKAASDVGQGD